MGTGFGREGAVASDDRGRALGFMIAVLRPLMMLFTRHEWRGAENVPAAGGCVLAFNHVSDVDPIVAGHFVVDNGRSPRFLGKAEVFDVPVLGRILTSAGHIPVHRQSADAVKAFAAAVDAVRSGRCVIVYPEGTITRDPGLWPMKGKTGAARIALATGCPLIPMAQWGPQHLLAPYSWRLKLLPRKLMQVAAGPPVDLADLADLPLTAEVLAEATERLLDAITGLVAELRGESPPEVRFDPKVAGVPTTGPPPRSRPDRRGRRGRRSERGRGSAP